MPITLIFQIILASILSIGSDICKDAYLYINELCAYIHLLAYIKEYDNYVYVYET